MKTKTILLSALFAFTGWFTQLANAQAFEKGGKYLSLHLSGSNYWHIDAQKNWANSWRGTNVGGVTLQMEWGIHKYVGLGFYTGVQGGVGSYGWFGSGWGGGYGELAIPIGMTSNFHFYQLIEDKTSKDIHGDKLDVYAGLSLGSGISFFPTPNWVSPLFFVGPHVGARYFVKPNLGLGLEAGYGKSFISGGLTFKL